MDKEEGNYSGTFPGLDYSTSLDIHENQEMMKAGHHIGSTSSDPNANHMAVDYMLNNPSGPPPPFCTSNSFDKLSFADVMQFADFGPKLALNQTRTPPEEESGIDPVYFLKFPVLNDHKLPDHDEDHHLSLMGSQLMGDNDQEARDNCKEVVGSGVGEQNNTSGQLRFAGENVEKGPLVEGKSKRKRPRTIKTSEEVESQRMTHIAVERNRRKQMNEHLRVLRSLMPSSYVQRGDQASIIGGAIEFVRELEQLLQCLESQKRRRLYGDGQRGMGDASMGVMQPQPQQQQQQQQQQATTSQPGMMFPPSDEMKMVEYEGAVQEEMAESKSCLADVEVKVLGFDALIKILSRRRPGQLIKAIAALEDLQLSILHTNITTIEQTVLYSFNVKIGGEARFTAEDIANSVQQIFSFIHANTGI